MEMMGLFGGLLGAGGSIASGLIGAEEAEETRQLNWAINVMNLQERRREREEAIAMALKARAEQKLGTTDIRGTRTHFVPGRGWVVEGGPGITDMIALQDKEQRKVLEHDLPQRRKIMDRNYARGLEEEGLADMFRRKLTNTYTPSDDELASDLYQAQAMGLREASQDAGRRLFTNVSRTGGNQRGYEETARTLSRENNAAYAKARLSSKLAAHGSGQAEADLRQKNLSNLYNLFATRAQQLPDVGYKPQNLDTQGTLAAAQQGDLSTGALATNMFAKQGGTLDYMQPNYGLANAVGGGASALASAFRGMGAQSAYNRGRVSGFGGGGGDDGEIYTATEGDFFTPS